MNITSKHRPVLLDEAIDFLSIKPNHWYVDATFGRGGHTKEMLKRQANIIAFDVDKEAIEYGKEYFSEEIYKKQLVLIRSNFSELEAQIKILNTKIDGILFDFGTSFDQLTSKDRGFSFQHEAPLDMRMDDRLGVTASDILSIVPEKQLAEMFNKYGGEKYSSAIAKKIAKVRTAEPITTTDQLVNIILKAKPKTHSSIHPATKVFQALRIVVNSELEVIEEALKQAFNLVDSGGRIVTISFHEGEDRIAKHLFKEWSEEGTAKVLTKKPITPDQSEIHTNPASRSAKLRAIQIL